MALLRALTISSIIIYSIVYYGQNFLEKGSLPRLYFYFIGMSVFTILISIALRKATKIKSASFLMFIVIGALVNNIFFKGEFSKIEVYLAICGIIYVSFESKIKKWMKWLALLQYLR